MSNPSLEELAQMESQVGSADWSRWTKNRFCYYDYAQLPPAGTNELQLFTVPYGSADPVTTTTKTLEQTNMNESRSFGRVNFLISQIRTHIRVTPKNRQASGISDQTTTIVALYTPLMNALLNLSFMGTLVINIGQKEYFDIPQPFITAPPGFGPTILQHGSVLAGAQTQGMWFVQDNNPDSVYRVKPEQLIEAGQTFNVKIAFDNANSPALTTLVNSTTPKVEIGVIFDGYVLRPVQ